MSAETAGQKQDIEQVKPWSNGRFYRTCQLGHLSFSAGVDYLNIETCPATFGQIRDGEWFGPTTVCGFPMLPGCTPEPEDDDDA